MIILTRRSYESKIIQIIHKGEVLVVSEMWDVAYSCFFPAVICCARARQNLRV